MGRFPGPKKRCNGRRQDRKERDAFVDEVMQASGIPILHFPASRAYTVEIARKALFAES
ncbi:MAG: DUF2726 domain-containing protein [bacterium]